MQQSEERLRVLARIAEYEKQGRFNDDVEEDDPAVPIKPSDVDYTVKKLSSKMMTALANFLGKTFFEKMIRRSLTVREFNSRIVGWRLRSKRKNVRIQRVEVSK